MKAKNHISSPLITGSVLLVSSILLPLIYIKPVEMMRLTAGELSRTYPTYSWIITGALMLFGIDSIISGWKHCGGMVFQRFMLLMFGSTFIANSLFNHLIQYDTIAAELPLNLIHRYFACVSLISFSVLAISAGFILIKDKSRILSFLSGVAVILAVVFQVESENYAGLWQKIIILIISGWINWYFKISINDTNSLIINKQPN